MNTSYKRFFPASKLLESSPTNQHDGSLVPQPQHPYGGHRDVEAVQYFCRSVDAAAEISKASRRALSLCSFLSHAYPND